MQFFIVLIASVILLALVFLGLGLKSLIGRNKSGRITSCRLSGSEKPGCGCTGAENCYHR
jgi:hypothetical protein